MRKLACFLAFPLTCFFIPLEIAPSKSLLLLDQIYFILFRNYALPHFRMSYLFFLFRNCALQKLHVFHPDSFYALAFFLQCFSGGLFFLLRSIFLDLWIFLYFPLVSIYNDNSLGPQGPMHHLSHQAHVLGVKNK